MPARAPSSRRGWPTIPDLVASGYQAMLDALPAELRAAYRDGNFQAELRDDEFQVIPTAWILRGNGALEAEGWREVRHDRNGGGPERAVARMPRKSRGGTAAGMRRS